MNLYPILRSYQMVGMYVVHVSSMFLTAIHPVCGIHLSSGVQNDQLPKTESHGDFYHDIVNSVVEHWLVLPSRMLAICSFTRTVKVLMVLPIYCFLQGQVRR